MKTGKKLHGEEKKIRTAKEVHHIKELKDYPELALEIGRASCRERVLRAV